MMARAETRWPGWPCHRQTPCEPAPPCREQNISLYKSFLDRLPKTHATHWTHSHYVRYASSLHFLRPVLCVDSRRPLDVLEIGTNGHFGTLLRHHYPDARVVGENHHDLRRERLPFADEGFDLVLLMEVVEHLKDVERPSDSIEKKSLWSGSGIEASLVEVRRLLRGGGALFLSTPNVASYGNIVRMLRGSHPFFFNPHPRELSAPDVRRLVAAAGLSVELLETVTSWGVQRGASRRQMQQVAVFAQERGFPTDLRGDDIFVLARRNITAGTAAAASQGRRLEARAGLERCAASGTVVVSVASGVYVSSLHALAASASAHGFGCVATLPYTATHANELSGQHTHVLAPPQPPLLPRAEWCGDPRYGWRRTHLDKMRLWRIVLDEGFDILSIDANYKMMLSPLPTLRALRTAPCSLGPRDCERWFPSDMRAGGWPLDVVGLHDGQSSKLLNIGLFWMRSTNATRALARVAENRTWGGCAPRQIEHGTGTRAVRRPALASVVRFDWTRHALQGISLPSTKSSTSSPRSPAPPAATPSAWAAPSPPTASSPRRAKVRRGGSRWRVATSARTACRSQRCRRLAPAITTAEAAAAGKVRAAAARGKPLWWTASGGRSTSTLLA
jgi:SAM-dependent methyltransferase